MTDHLPECPLLEPCDDEVAEHGYCSMQHGVFCIHCHQWCICDRLRACEQRVLDAAREAILHDEYCLSNLDDADERDCDCARPSAVAAIDALRVNQPMASGGIYAGLPIPLGDGCVIPKSGNTALREKP